MKSLMNTSFRASFGLTDIVAFVAEYQDVELCSALKMNDKKVTLKQQTYNTDTLSHLENDRVVTQRVEGNAKNASRDSLEKTQKLQAQ